MQSTTIVSGSSSRQTYLKPTNHSKTLEIVLAAMVHPVEDGASGDQGDGHKRPFRKGPFEPVESPCKLCYAQNGDDVKSPETGDYTDDVGSNRSPEDDERSRSQKLHH